VAVAGELGRALAALARIHEVLVLVSEEAQDRGKLRVRSVSGAVTFEDVSYGYVPQRMVLRHVSFHAPAGAIVAIWGPNGAGKSTLFSLLAGFDDPTAGRILVDGQALASLDRAAYRRHLGVVLQRDHLIDSTIADNIRYARPRATMAEFRQAARLAHCDEFVEGLPEGYATKVGEQGVRLSGGQRQRLAIARALLVDPRILLLDEATAHLDPETEWLVQDAIATLCSGRTTFVIAHRLATIRRADQVLVLQAGAVVERGTEGQVALRDGQYARGYSAQHGDAGNLADESRFRAEAAAAVTWGGSADLRCPKREVYLTGPPHVA
jgi:subfamily B ATP-binding cassette protein MsbA